MMHVPGTTHENDLLAAIDPLQTRNDVVAAHPCFVSQPRVDARQRDQRDDSAVAKRIRVPCQEGVEHCTAIER